MKRFAILSAAALIGLGAVASTGAEAGHRRGHGGGAIAAGVIGGLAAGALLGAAASNAYAAPAYGYGYAPAYGYGYAPTTRVVQSYGYAPEVYEEAYVPRRAYRTTRVVRRYEAPAYRMTRVVRSDDSGYAPAGYWGGPGVNVGFGGGFFGW
jgi:hypothetical protein